MSATMHLLVDGRRIEATEGMTVATALLNAGIDTFRVAVGGGARAPLCGMGVCYECRVTIDGVAHRRACVVGVADGMSVTTAREVAR